MNITAGLPRAISPQSWETSIKKFLFALAAPAVALFTMGAASAVSAPLCMPRVEGPVTFKDRSEIFARSPVPAGVVEEEYFISCDISGGSYKTLLHVRRTQDSAKQSGIVMVEPWHPNGGWSLYSKISDYEAKAGVVNVIVAGNPMIVNTMIKPSNAARYATLILPGKGARSYTDTVRNETTEMEILGQVGPLIKSGGLPGVKARKVILGGMSQTGGVVRAFVAFEHSQPGVKSTYDAYFPEQSALPSYRTPLPDLDVPVIELQGERELIVMFERGADHVTYRRADGPLYRLYEVPGMPHITTRGARERSPKDCTGRPLTNFPTNAIYGAALNNLIAWLDDGVPAPHVPWIETSVDGREIKRDALGNALGGYRTSYFDVPIANYHATWDSYTMAVPVPGQAVTGTGATPSDAVAARCDMIGWTRPLSKDQLQKLYPTHAAYVAKVDQDIADMVRKHLLLPDDARELRDEAKAAPVP